MTTSEIANKLVEYMREGKYEQAHQEFYHEDIVSIENPAFPNDILKYEKSVGMAAKQQKAKEWQAMIAEMHEAKIGDAVVSGDNFVVPQYMKATFTNGQTQVMNELGIYSVKDGKILKEEFIF